MAGDMLNDNAYLSDLVKFRGGYSGNCIKYYRGKGSKEKPWLAEWVVLSREFTHSKEFRTLREAVRYRDNHTGNGKI